MTAYVCNYQKKKDTLSRREVDLQRAIVQKVAPERILKAVQNVRDAQIRVIHAKIAEIPPCDEAGEDRIVLLNQKLKEWLSLSVEDVLRLYTK